MEIIFKAIGYIESPFKNLNEIPRQSVFSKDKKAKIRLLDEYVDGIEGVLVDSYIVVLFHFHKSNEKNFSRYTKHYEGPRGVFATRSPHRPNGIGLSIVKVENIHENIIEISGVDMLDGTPVIDIKPYSENLNPDINTI